MRPFVLLLLITSLAHARDLREFGAVPDDGLNDYTALRKALAAGPVEVPAGVFNITSQVVLPNGTNISGVGTLVCNGLVSSGNSSIEGVTIDADGFSYGVKATGGRLFLRGVTVRNARYFLVDADGPVELIAESCTFSDTMHGVRFKGPARGKVCDSDLSNWLHYALSIEGTAEAGPTVTVDGNYFHDPKPGKGGARYMILANNPAKVVNIRPRITNNRCIGPGEPFDRTSDISRGTADQISVYYSHDFVVSGNLSQGGGENGISITLGSHRGIVSGNISSGNDAHGIEIGSKNGQPDPDVTDILVTGNQSSDNGCRLDGQGDVMAGIYLQDAARVSIRGNQVVDSRATRMQKYGILMAECSEIDLGENTVQFADTAGRQSVAIFASTLSKPTDIYHPIPRPK